MTARNMLGAGISSFFILLYMIIILNVGYVYVDRFATTDLIISFIIAMALPVFASIDTKRLHKLQFYTLLVVLLYTYVMAMLAINKPTLLFIAIIPFVINLLIFQSKYLKSNNEKYKALTFVSIMIFMYLVSGVLKIVIPGVKGYDFAIALYSDNITPSGIQAIMIGAMTFFSHVVVFSLSPGDFLLLVSISAILTENYSMIYTYLKNRGKGMVSTTVSGTVTALSCQCESLAAAFPTVIALLLSTIIVPLMIETVGSIILTFFLVSKLYMKGREWNFAWKVERWSSGNGIMMLLAIPIILVPLLETFGVYLGWLNIFLFFAGINFLMFLTGVAVPVLLNKAVKFRGFTGLPAIIALLALSTVIMYIWFVPSMIALAHSSPSYFAIMNISAIVSGILSGTAYVSTRAKENRRLLLEFISMMTSMYAIIVFYASVVGRMDLYPIFSQLQITEFSIAMFGATLPFMWLSTHLTLSSYITEEPPKVKKGQRGTTA